MKKISFLCTLFLALSATVFAQRIIIPDLGAYKKLIAIDTLVFTAQYRVDMVEDVQKPENITTETMMLRVGRTLSEYYSYTSFIADSVLRADIDAGASQQTISEHLRQYGFGAISHRIYKNYPKGKLTLLERIIMDNYRVDEPMPKINWTIHADTATVLGYACRKATARFLGRDYEAWFAPEIPRSDGPWKLHGLPGLILKAQDTEKEYVFLCTGIEQSKTARPIEFAETSRRTVSRKELNRLCERYNADPQGYVRTNAPNVKLTVNDNMGNEIKKMSNPYNPIELE